jgi:hypothetical protein
LINKNRFTGRVNKNLYKLSHNVRSVCGSRMLRRKEAPAGAGEDPKTGAVADVAVPVFRHPLSYIYIIGALHREIAQPYLPSVSWYLRMMFQEKD